ncbi:MAG: hypothetical protein HYY16_12910 [Planctomycetes bacterium]|nr:hypothetical protein [Planctomycetota bacterium]
MKYPCAESGRNKSAGRSLPLVTPYFTRATGKRRFFALDEKPDLLKHLDTIDQRAWKQYDAHLRRIPPLERAEFYRGLIEQKKLRSVCALARLLGQQEEGLRPYLNLLKLPEPILRFLKENRTPAFVRYLSVKRLQPLVKLDAREAWRRFQQMVMEAKGQPSLWNKAGQ